MNFIFTRGVCVQNVLRVLLTFAICISSCTQVRNIKNSQEPESYYAKVTKASYGKISTIITTSGESYEGTDVVVDSDSTKWVLESSGERLTYPTDKIHQVRIKDRFKGFVGGFLFGIPAGLGALLIAGALELDLDPPEGFTQVHALIIGVTIGALVGGGIGAVRGHRDEYIMNSTIEN